MKKKKRRRKKNKKRRRKENKNKKTKTKKQKEEEAREKGHYQLEKTSIFFLLVFPCVIITWLHFFFISLSASTANLSFYFFLFPFSSSFFFFFLHSFCPCAHFFPFFAHLADESVSKKMEKAFVLESWPIKCRKLQNEKKKPKGREIFCNLFFFTVSSFFFRAPAQCRFAAASQAILGKKIWGWEHWQANERRWPLLSAEKQSIEQLLIFSMCWAGHRCW